MHIEKLVVVGALVDAEYRHHVRVLRVRLLYGAPFRPMRKFVKMVKVPIPRSNKHTYCKHKTILYNPFEECAVKEEVSGSGGSS